MNIIGIVVVAVQIEQNVIERFKTTLAESTQMPYCLKVVSDDEYLENGLLNKSRALNDGVREMIKQSAIVVCTDIDVLVPPGLVEYTLRYSEVGSNLWVVCRNISEKEISPRRWNHWLSLPLRTSGTGSWNAMFRKDWIRSGGFDERLVGWGGEDDVFAMRRKQIGIENVYCEAFSLMHIIHSPRQNRKKFEAGNVKALSISSSASQYNWLLCK